MAMSLTKAEARMRAIMDSLDELRSKRSESRNSNDFADVLAAQSMDNRIGELEEELEELERQYPEAAQQVND